ncbi:hypothetical protein GZ77_01245 [Endozoicomonas montiporae]|uniref:Uncharacterized protein n=1 Tax=Endozoicomonas montiporae TaxID=1027273 RepID=A0A081NA40_9GAMM|nr:hypothetical protein [Endozoicomonas montiporae]KEQ15313.1 hypothetical protein GZ77_01245 [Endozoicomonas montiporae]
MTVTMGGIRYFLFLSALLLNAVVSEASSDERFCSIGSKTYYPESGEKPDNWKKMWSRHIVTPDGKKLTSIDFRVEFDWQSIMPLNIRLGSGVNNKVRNIALQSVIRRTGEVFMDKLSLYRQLKQTDCYEEESKPWRIFCLNFCSSSVIDYIFQDTYHGFDEVILLENRWDGSTLYLDDRLERHSLGDLWVAGKQEIDGFHRGCLYVAYLDQGIFLLVYEQGFQFLDFDGFFKLVGYLIQIGEQWASLRLSPKKTPLILKFREL